MKRIVKAATKIVKKLPATPSMAEIVSGTDAETSSAPDSTFSAAPESPSHDSSSDSRSCSTVAGNSLRKSRTAATIGSSSSSASTRTASAAPSTVIVAASPRDNPVFAITSRTGILEDEREEDADEDEQERGADRDERGHHAERGHDEQDRAHREDERYALRVTGLQHGGLTLFSVERGLLGRGLLVAERALLGPRR